jgi:hypothetical protein
MGFWDFLSSATGNTEDPSKEANKYMSQIPGVGKQYYNPFIDRGNRAGNTLEGEYGRMMNPTSFMDDIMKNYKMSEGAQYEQDKLGKGIGSTAAAGGFAGTPEHQRSYGEMAGKIMSGDMQQYLTNALGIHDRGMTGEEGFFNKGFDASSSLADLLGGTLASQGTMAYQGAQQKNANQSALFSAIAKALATGAGAYFGGAPGAAAGAQLF